MNKSKARRIVVFDANPLIGNKTGVGSFTFSLVKNMAEEFPYVLFVGHYFNFLDSKDPQNLPEADNISYKVSRLIPTKLINQLRKIGLELPYEVFTRTKADAALFTNFFSYPTLFGSKIATIIYDTSYLDFPEYVSDKNAQFLAKNTPKSVTRSDVIFTISDFSKERIAHHYPDYKEITVLEIPVDDKAMPDENTGDKFQLPEKYILFLGTLEPRKNLKVLLEAFKGLKDEYGLVVAGGKGWKDEKILSKIENLKSKGKKIVQTGYISEGEKSYLYSKAAVYVQPSHYEGFGMPILEAMSYSCPVICSDIPVFREVAGSAAQYFKTTDSEQLGKLLQCTLSDKQTRDKYTSLSQKHISKYVSWQDVIEKAKTGLNL